MKRFLPFVLLLALALTGCQSTPEAPIVAGKSSDDLLEKAAAETSGALAQRVEAPARYEDAFASTGGELQVTVDAAVTVPDADKVPIVRVTPANITQDQAYALMDTLVQGELYDFDTPETKSEIADKIVEAKRRLAEGPTEDEENTVYLSADDDSGEDVTMTWEEYMQDAIDRLTEQYDAAPETAEKQVTTGELKPDADDERALQAGGENTTKEHGWEALDIEAYEDTQYLSRAWYVRDHENTGVTFTYLPAESFNDFFLFSDIDIASIPDVTVTADEARAMCDSVVKALDIPDMAFYAICKKYGGAQEAPRCCWELQYTRNIGGVPVAYSSIDVGINGMPADTQIFQIPWTNEKLNFYVNDDGIVAMEWESPYELTETVTEDAALLPFSDVMDIFKKMYVVENDGQAKDVTVDRICLSYMRVSERDKNYTGLLVPVWDFYGTELWHPEGGEDYTSFYDPDSSMLTINAVDGTIIDRGLGY